MFSLNLGAILLYQLQNRVIKSETVREFILSQLHRDKDLLPLFDVEYKDLFCQANDSKEYLDEEFSFDGAER